MGARDKVFGIVMCVLAVLIGVVYFYMIFTPLWWTALRFVVSTGVLIVLGILFWVGWTIARTPTVEEIEAAGKTKPRK